MYEDYYGFTEKPFSLTPDPKYLYKSASHANAFELLQYAIRRREGFVVITGDIGTGKTTLCRAILEQIDRKTFTALVLNPFLSEDDLLRLILQEFGVVSRDEIKRGRLAGVSKQELIETLNEFLLSLQALRAQALLIIDEAQNLPLQVLEQIRILSNLETEKEEAAADRPRRAVEPEGPAAEARAAPARSARVDPLRPEAAVAGRDLRLRPAPAVGGGRRRGGVVRAEVADAHPSLHRRHSAIDQPAVRSRAPVRLLGAHEPDRARVRGQRRRIARAAAAQAHDARLGPAEVRGVRGRDDGGRRPDRRGRHDVALS